MRRIALIAAAALALAQPAYAFEARNSLRVAQTSATDFTVGYKNTAKLTDYWCAAGDFAARGLGVAGPTRVYRLSPPPRGAGQGISFTLDPARAAGETGLTTFGGKQDGAFSAQGAVSSFCYDYDIERF